MKRRWQAWMVMALSLARASRFAGDAIAASDAQHVSPTPPDRRLSSAIAHTQEEIRQAVRELNAVRDAIAAARIPLAREWAEWERRVADLREEVRRLRRARAEAEEARERATRETANLQDACQFLFSALTEYRRGLETRMTLAESQPLQHDLTTLDEALSATDNPAVFPAITEKILTLAARWNRARLGGVRFEGLCLDADGSVHRGHFAVFGPVSYFVSATGTWGGIAFAKVGSSFPTCFALASHSKHATPLADLIAGRESVVPVDVSGGDVLKYARSRKSWADEIRSGGIVMIPIVVVGILSAALVTAKIAQLARLRIPSTERIREAVGLMASGRLDEAGPLVETFRSPLAAILRHGMPPRPARREQLEEGLYAQAVSLVPILERHLGVLAALGNVAPLLGLLGTVSGIMHTFQVVSAFGTSDPRLFSAGISEALVTTKFGLGIAIPVLLAHAYLSRRVRKLEAAMEHAIALVLHAFDHPADTT